jgi:hypothetical protein
VNIAQTRGRAAAGIVVAALLISSCGGGDSGSTADEAPVTTEDATETPTESETLTEYDLVRVSPANRKALEAELDAGSMFHVWDGSRLTVLSSDEAIVEDYLNTLFAADVPDGADGAAAAPGVKNNAIESWFNKTTKSASDTYKGGVKGYEDWSKKNLKRVSKEYRNAEGEVVDAAGKVVEWLPTSWPKTLPPDYLGQVVRDAEKQLKSFEKDLRKEAKRVGNMNAKLAEAFINKSLSSFPVEFTTGLSVKSGLEDLASIVPQPAAIGVDIKNEEWDSDGAMNLYLKLNFLGIKSYKVQFGCLGFPNGQGNAPIFVPNGGCQNPWDIRASKDMVVSAAKKVANQAGPELEGMGYLILAVLISAAEEIDFNPRILPPDLIAPEINFLLAVCCSFALTGTPSLDDWYADFVERSEKTDQELLLEALLIANSVYGIMSEDTGMGINIPDLGDFSYTIDTTLSTVAILDQRWTRAGKMEIGLELTGWGIFSATVKMGCITFGTSWFETPSFTFEGGCDNSWGVKFAVGGSTVGKIKAPTFGR